MLQFLLDEAAGAGTGDNGGGLPSYLMWILVGVIVVGFAVWMVISSKKRKKQEQEAKDLIDAVKPGNKVKTIGGVCGIVVEVNTEENTFVLETGSETSGKSYIKFDKQAIYNTDAVVEKNAPAKANEEVPSTEDTTSETKPEEAVEATEATQTAETSEVVTEDNPVLVKPKKDKKAKPQTEENQDK